MHFASDELTADIDVTRFTLNEAILIEEQTGLDIEGLGTRAMQNNLRAIGALLWISRLRQLAADQDIGLDEAAAQLPRARFDVNLVGMRVTSSDPTDAPTPGPETPTSPATSKPSSATRPKARGGGRGASGTSARSRTSSGSAPGRSAG